MRRVLLKWLLQVAGKFQVKDETMQLCVQLIDFVLVFEAARINKGNFQLLGVSALFIASKYNEIHTYEADKYIYLCDGLYQTHQLFDMEAIILIATNFSLQLPTLSQFTGIAIQRHGPHLTSVITELSRLALFDFTLLNRFKKQHLSAVIVYFAQKLHDPSQVRSQEVMQEKEVPEEVFKECFMLLLGLYRSRDELR